MLVSEALELIASQGGFDPAVSQTSDTKMRSWLSTVVQEAVASARWLKQRRNFGPTVAGTDEYAVDADVVWIKSLRVGPTRPWARTTLEEMWAAEAQPYVLTGGAPGAYAPVGEAEDAQDVEAVPSLVKLLPAPTASGLKIEAVCAVNHKAITVDTAGTYRLQLPDDLAQRIAVDGAVGLGIMRVHERADLAAPYLARFESGKAELKQRASSLVGGGVRYIPVRRR